MPSKTFKYLSSFDEFGRPIGLNYTQNEDHKTWCGTSLSILKLAFMIFYISHLAIVCIFRRDPDIQYSDVYRDVNELEKELNAVEIGFDIAFELFTETVTTTTDTFSDASQSGIDETYFNISAYAMSKKPNGQSTFEQIPVYKCLEFEEKTGRRPFKYVEREKFERVLARATCIDMESINFKGTALYGDGVAYGVLQCMNDGGPGKPVCKGLDEINRVAEKIQVATFVSQNYFSSNNYTDPIQAEIGLVGGTAIHVDRTVDTYYNVEYSVVELFDSRLRIFDDEAEGELEFMSAQLSVQAATHQFSVGSQKVYAVNRFNLVEKGKLYKRKVATIWNLFEDFGGMNEAICLTLAPFVLGIAERSFSYDLVSRHMKVKQRNNKKPTVPTEPINSDVAQSIMDMAAIKSVTELLSHNKCSMICLPKWCNMNGNHKKVHKLMKRGTEQYEQSTDVLNFIRMGHRLRIIEQLLFNKGQLAMIGLHKERYLKPVSSESEEDPVHAPDSEDNFEEAERYTCEMLQGYQITCDIDKKLWSHCILGPKNQEEKQETARPESTKAQLNDQNASTIELVGNLSQLNK